MIREYTIRLDDTLKGFDDDVDELERRFDAEEIPQRHWIVTEYHRVRCPVCREKGVSDWYNTYDIKTNYCPNCGTKMTE